MPRARAFTIVELLVVVSIIGVLIGLLLPAISNARNQAKTTRSESNLRQIGIAHAAYAGEWNDRQFTLTRDDMSSYGADARSAVEAYHLRRLDEGEDLANSWPPPPVLGWSGVPNSASYRLEALAINPNFKENYSLLEPIAFRGAWGNLSFDKPRFGYFRLPNAHQFSRYLSGRFYDPVFYAPKDSIVMEMLEPTQEMPDEFPRLSVMRENYGWGPDDFCYSSYSLSPAALFSPDVMRGVQSGGWQNPWKLSGGFRAPSMSQARYSGLKTHVIEHHWLQNRRTECNDAFTEARERPYKGCQPYFFNHAQTSAPVCLFYDGHVQLVGVGEAMGADGRVQAQIGVQGAGLWSRDTPFGPDGYFIDRGYDTTANTSFHILTTDGIRGRDIVDDGT